MNNNPKSGQVDSAVDSLFGAEATTASGRLILNVCKVSGIIAFSGPIIGFFTDTLHWIPRPVAVTVLVIAVLTFITTFCILGIRSAGQSAGKRTFLSQAWYTFSRVTLYIFLPCAVLTLLIILWAIATKQPNFR